MPYTAAAKSNLLWLFEDTGSPVLLGMSIKDARAYSEECVTG